MMRTYLATVSAQAIVSLFLVFMQTGLETDTGKKVSVSLALINIDMAIL